MSSATQIFTAMRAGNDARRLSFGLAERRAALDRLAQAIRRNEAAIVAALAADLGRPAAEAILSDYLPVLQDIAHNLKATVRAGEVGGMVDGMVEIHVSDCGSGLPEDVRARLFEPFFSTKADGGGLGLGLAISRDIAREAGGELEADNAPGGGARFILRLPVPLPSPPNPLASSPSP